MLVPETIATAAAAAVDDDVDVAWKEEARSLEKPSASAVARLFLPESYQTNSPRHH